MRGAIALVGVLVALSAPPVAAATIATDADTYVDAADPSATFGTSRLLRVAPPSSDRTGGARALFESRRSRPARRRSSCGYSRPSRARDR